MKRILVLLVLSFSIVGFSCAKKNTVSSPAEAQKPSLVSTAQKKEAVKPKSVPTAVTKGGVSLIEAEACRSVENRNPVGAGDKFQTDVGRIYVYTKVALDASQEAKIKHVWRFKGKDVANVILTVKGPQWRTYSSKQMDPTHKGDWAVDVTTEKGDVLKSISFKIE